MYDTARFIESCIGLLVQEAEQNGLVEVARLLKLASTEARELAELFDALPHKDAQGLTLH